jgi:hypothetical protein
MFSALLGRRHFATVAFLKALSMANTPSSRLSQGDVAGAISGFYGVSSADPSVAKLLALVFPEVERATARDPGSWKSVFPGVLAKYESMAKDLGLGVSPQQREIDAARNANPTAAGGTGLDFGKLAGLHHPTKPLAMRDDGESRSSGERVTAAALSRSAPLSVDGAIGYARELGMNPALAGFFVGTSHEMRDALRGAIRNGTSITDDQVKNPNDAAAVIGAIRAGKMKPDDPRVPPSVRQIIDDMKKDGLDPATADPKRVKKYLDDHPAALDAAKKKLGARIESTASKSDAQVEGNLDAKLQAKLARKAGSGGADNKWSAAPPKP